MAKTIFPRKQEVIDAVIEELKKDFSNGDYTVIEELLCLIPTNNLMASLPEDKSNLLIK